MERAPAPARSHSSLVPRAAVARNFFPLPPRLGLPPPRNIYRLLSGRRRAWARARAGPFSTELPLPPPLPLLAHVNN